jgi:hypothetical protein
MQQNVFMEPVPAVRMAVLAVGALCAVALLLAVLLAVFSTTWRTRLMSAGRHALWIVPVFGLLLAAVGWRFARSQPATMKFDAGWPRGATLTVPETPWPIRDGQLLVPSTETFTVPTSTVHYRGAPISWLIGLGVAGVVIALVFAARLLRRHAGALIPVGGVLAALGLLGGAMLTSLTIHEQRVARTVQVQQQLEARRVADVLRHRELAGQQRSVAPVSVAPSQVLDYRGRPPTVPDDSATTAPSGESESPAAAETTGAEIVAYVGRDALGERLTELPEWVSGSANDPDARIYSSGLWVTTEEADQELARKLAPALSEYFWAQHPQATGWSPSEVLCAQSGAVARRCYESVPMQLIGEHSHTMHRAYWQVRHTPESARFLFDNWRPLAVQQRLVWLGGGVILLTLLCGAASAYFRIDAATAGRYRGRLRFATGAVCLAGGVAAILLA